MTVGCSYLNNNQWLCPKNLISMNPMHLMSEIRRFEQIHPGEPSPKIKNPSDVTPDRTEAPETHLFR
jgi:hypothetical protein